MQNLGYGNDGHNFPLFASLDNYRLKSNTLYKEGQGTAVFISFSAFLLDAASSPLGDAAPSGGIAKEVSDNIAQRLREIFAGNGEHKDHAGVIHALAEAGIGPGESVVFVEEARRYFEIVNNLGWKYGAQIIVKPAPLEVMPLEIRNFFNEAMTRAGKREDAFLEGYTFDHVIHWLLNLLPRGRMDAAPYNASLFMVKDFRVTDDEYEAGQNILNILRNELGLSVFYREDEIQEPVWMRKDLYASQFAAYLRYISIRERHDVFPGRRFI